MEDIVTLIPLCLCAFEERTQFLNSLAQHWKLAMRVRIIMKNSATSLSTAC